jgi:predicted dehydrogenase
VFQTGSQQRSDWNFRYAAELVRNGKIGQLKTVYVGVGGPSSEKLFPEEPVPEGLDWDMWLGPAPFNPYNSERCSGNYGGGWRQVRDTSGGMMTDWGAHHFDIAQWGMGMDDSGPIEISPPEAKEYPSLTYKYASGVLMHHWFGNDTRQYQMPAGKGGGPNGILFVGTEGWVEVNRGYLNSEPAALTRTADGQQKEMLQFKPDEIHLHASKGGHHGDWFNSMRDRSRPVADVEIGCRTITVCHLGNIAYWTRRKLKWDPATEEIVGDPEAARWLDRPKRAPWTLL